MNKVQTAILAGLLCLPIACSSPRGSVTGADEQAVYPPRYERVIAPFEVRDLEGRPYEEVFTGGFNLPRPQFVDIDGDHDLDLFVQETTGAVRFFEQVGTAQQPRYQWRTDRYMDLEVGEWNRFIDLDQDGDLDLLAEAPFSYIRVYMNDGSPRSPSFSLVVDTLKDVTGTPIFSDRQNIPNVVDIDCDGNLDLFIGRMTGTVMRYGSVGEDASGLPRFRLVTERFEDIEIVAQFGSLHGANAPGFADLDQDGDQDFFWGDFFEPGLLYIENLGTCERPSLRGDPQPFPPNEPVSTSGFNVSYFADIDQDEDLDLFIGVLGGAFNPNTTTADNFLFYEQERPGHFEKRASRYLYHLDVGSESIPAFADLDGDGDLDLLLSNKIDPEHGQSARVYHFENMGTLAAPAYQHVGFLDLEPSFHHAPSLADLDADGDLDLLLGGWNKRIAFYRNEGNRQAAAFSLVDLAYIELTRGSNTTPALVDIDADGDLDLFSGESSGTLNFYRNDGSPDAPRFELVTDTYDDIDVGRRSFPTFVDLDADGDQDLLLGSESKGVLLYRNEGTAATARFVPDTTFVLEVPFLATPAFVDFDADGDLDLCSGGNGGGLVCFAHR